MAGRRISRAEKAAVVTLLADRGISLDARLLPLRDPPAGAVQFETDEAGNDALAAAFLGAEYEKEPLGAAMLRYAGPSGTVLIKSGCTVTVELFGATGRGRGENAARLASEIFKAAGLKLPALQSRSSGEALYEYVYEGFEVDGGTLSVSVEGDTVVFDGVILRGSQSRSSARATPAVSLLADFAFMADGGGFGEMEITSVSFGYVHSASGGVSVLSPVCIIETAEGEFVLDAATGRQKSRPQK